MTWWVKRHSISLILLCGSAIGCDLDYQTPTLPSAVEPSSKPQIVPIAISRFCGDCHAFPSPDKYPKDAWYKEVKQGFDFYTDSKRMDLVQPKLSDVVSWYRSRATEVLPKILPLPPGSSPIQFNKQSIPCQSGERPMISSIVWDESPSSAPQFRLTDMASGHVCEVLVESALTTRELLIAGNPACSKMIDLDNDGLLDLVIADLGSEGPADHEKGTVRFLPGGNATNVLVTILDGVGRVCDISVADFDKDGDPDLVVAEFGWHKSGGILLLENLGAVAQSSGSPAETPRFKCHRIDGRHGTIHIPVADLNSDGIPDFVALISQEFETIEAFLGNGDLTFRREIIHAPQDPAFGSCGIELVDIDNDGDQDIVYCNGDTLDGLIVKHYHGVNLLINEGVYPYSSRKILSLAGASDSAIADFDADGDLDIAVSGFLPLQLYDQLPDKQFDSLCWLEQTNPLVFKTHLLERSTVGHLSLTSGDFNRDGAVDIAVGNYPGEDWGAVWWNMGRH